MHGASHGCTYVSSKEKARHLNTYHILYLLNEMIKRVKLSLLIFHYCGEKKIDTALGFGRLRLGVPTAFSPTAGPRAGVKVAYA